MIMSQFFFAKSTIAKVNSHLDPIVKAIVNELTWRITWNHLL